MRLIDAKEVERQIKNGMPESPVVMGMMLRWIRKQPTIDAETVRHGHWIEKHSMYVQDGAYKRKCSACNKYTNNIGEPLRYCPNCGAKMDEEC